MKRSLTCLFLLMAAPAFADPPSPEVVKTEAEWHKVLTPEQYRVLREKGTEAPYSGKWEKNTQGGTYYCAACDNELFTSDKKFDAGCGWPSFFAAAAGKRVILQPDHSHGMNRTEVMCARCHSHLGHLFNDGPAPTSLRYCINSVCLKFVPAKK